MTWGVAFKADSSVLPHLDHREKNGYTVHQVTFHPLTEDTPPFTVLVYIATETNTEYLGPASIDTIAREVAKSSGPSGCNVEYVLNLARTMRCTFPNARDSHLFELEEKVREMLGEAVSCGRNSVVCDSCEYHSPLASRQTVEQSA